ncbi:hypothetical protein FNT36_06575 [Hymenobacter setariae]|uniref:Uncharacterized protein n=1 Tax=Hymenobacter setariae TaxID=2594794 RepID=A0A558C4Q5_9BACT|nr:hypothetical protein [Hymenobacter setariae]TVT43746.1 hypothetical protein FNT36_06575 [Hymenobacter setariae]
MFNTTAVTPHTYFENSVGRLLEHPAGHYISVEYRTGPRKLSELQAFLSHAGQLLARRGWDKLLSHQGLMTPFTPEEIEWITGFWRTKAQQRTDMLYGALLLPHDVFARLSWKGGSLSATAPASTM